VPLQENARKNNPLPTPDGKIDNGFLSNIERKRRTGRRDNGDMGRLERIQVFFLRHVRDGKECQIISPEGY
jgi:hypothetical protein